MTASTAGCPLGARCESCGRAGDDLAVVVSPSPFGTICWTACPMCAGSTTGPAIAETTAGRFAAQHRAHGATPTTDVEGGR